MSWHFSRALVEAYSAAGSSAGKPSAPSRTTPTHGIFWSPGKTMDASKPSRSGMTFRPSMEGHGEALLMWCLAASRAKTSAQPVKVPESKASEAVCGDTWRESSVKYCLDSSSWKTHQCLWEEVLEWSSVILPKWGMMRNGALWERITPARLTSGIESGSWPTPRACMTGAATPERLNDKFRNLEKAVAQTMWPTPSSNSGTGGCTGLAGGSGNRLKLYKMLGEEEGKKMGCQSLNPLWVEWLMGWPLGWTDCAASATDRFRQWCQSHGISSQNELNAKRLASADENLNNHEK